MENTERRGPEYVRPEIWQAREERRKRRMRWAVGPIVVVAFGAAALAMWMPSRIAAGKLTLMLATIPKARYFHAVERRAGEQEGVLRDEYIDHFFRRYSLFGGEVELINSKDGEWAYERTPGTRRKHDGVFITPTTLDRLKQDCESRRSRVSFGEDGILVVETDSKRYEINQDAENRPSSWRTFYRTESGFQPLWETVVSYGAFDPENLKPDFETEVKYATMKNVSDPVYDIRTAKALIGDLRLTGIDVNKDGDLILTAIGPYERPFLKVTEGNGVPLSPVQLQAVTYRNGEFYRHQFICMRISGDKPIWPFKVKVEAHNFDPRFEVEGFPNKKLGTLDLSFDKPTCSYAPGYWFEQSLSDRVYFDYLRTRAYRLSLIYQNAMRTKEGTFVDIMNGGASGYNEDSLSRSAIDMARAIEEVRRVIRLKAEYNGGDIPLSSFYTQLATLYLDAGFKEQARETVDFLRDTVRSDRTDPTVVSEIDRLSKEVSK